MKKIFLYSLLILFSAPAAAQDWPSKPLRIVVPFSPGGIADTSARTIADRLGARLGQPVVIENRPGAAGNIGSEMVARSAPDGYVLLLGYDGTIVVNPHIYAKTGFDVLRDFAPVTKIGDAGVLVVSHPSLPVKDLRELIALGKSKPGTLSYGTAGTGSSAHLACEMLSQRTGAGLVHVPYKGGGQAIADTVGGQIPLACTALAGANQFLKSGRLRGLGLSSARRAAGAPDVPTFIESGLPGFVVDSWVGILAPAKTPQAIVDRLQREIAAVLKEPEVRERLGVLGIEPVGNSPEEFAAQIRADLERWGPVVKQAGIRIE
ncbi:MAG TPA: tripartite tricarboxylate transporter substrate binding protein [Burkholderiales bacterium]|nr:tripartite tricarboxylate transporter substrate binding protein [Burkholderiales bacterium]